MSAALASGRLPRAAAAIPFMPEEPELNEEETEDQEEFIGQQPKIPTVLDKYGQPRKTDAEYARMAKDNEALPNWQIEDRVDEIAAFLLKWPLSSKYEIRREFCPKFEIHWKTCDRYVQRARAVNRRITGLEASELRTLGKTILLDALKSPNEMIRLKAERSLSQLAGYDAPPRAPVDEQGKTVQFVPLTVSPAEIVGENPEKK